MKFCVVGINHHVAPIEVRERVHFKETDIIQATDDLTSDSLSELVVLSTCNRSEIYFLSTSPGEDIERVASYLQSYFSIAIEDKDFIKKSGD
ncbi:MAG: hypothetical protein PUG74_04085, partial [Prevotellaceae bacterium]|nr:hypothetical protein [Prevotellaceae bacterium]